MTERERLEHLYIILVSLHSMGVGFMLLAAPHWSVQFGGWRDGGVVFFVRQGGAFHFVLAAGYLIEHFRYRGIVLLVTAKSMAFVFLCASTVLMDSPWLVPFSAVADGLMGLIAVLVHRWARGISPWPALTRRSLDLPGRRGS
jgi:hypothetical protein